MTKKKTKKIEFEINENECFEVISHSKHNGGYTKILIDGKRQYTHRFIYEQCFGELEEGETVRQVCGNPSCINPEHLMVGTGGEAFTEHNKNKAKKLEFEIDENGCFNVTSHVADDKDRGHTKFQINGNRVHIHRHIYEECFGEIEDGLVVRHTCDNGKCVNPEHLMLGTQRDNIQDMIDRDRNSFYKNTKLDIEKVREIKVRLKNGEHPKDICLDYGVSKQTISLIKKGKSWKNVTV